MDDNNDNGSPALAIGFLTGVVVAGFLVASVLTSDYPTSTKLFLAALVVALIGVGLVQAARSFDDE